MDLGGGGGGEIAATLICADFMASELPALSTEKYLIKLLPMLETRGLFEGLYTVVGLHELAVPMQYFVTWQPDCESVQASVTVTAAV